MQIFTSMLKVQDVWRKLLVVQSESELSNYENEFVDRFTDEGGDEIRVIYYIDEVYKTFTENGFHWYWLLYSSDRMTVNGSPSDDAIAALQLLGVQTEE